MMTPIEAITEADLQALVEGGVPESRDLDYKRDAYGGRDDDKKEYLADISALANTVGGHLVLGMDERDGVASELVGCEIDPDKECLRLENLARDGLQPRLQGVRVRAIALENGKRALLVRVPRSWSPPHRVVAQKSNRFWARTDRQKYEPDVDQLRDLFAVAPSIAEKIRDFWLHRLALIESGEGLLGPDRSSGALVLHVVPYDSLRPGVRLSTEALSGLKVSPFKSSSWRSRLNSDGKLFHELPLRKSPVD